MKPELADGHMSRRGKLDRWVPGPFVVLTLSQHLLECRSASRRALTAYRCADGNVRCADCKPAAT